MRKLFLSSLIVFLFVGYSHASSITNSIMESNIELVKPDNDPAKKTDKTTTTKKGKKTTVKSKSAKKEECKPSASKSCCQPSKNSCGSKCTGDKK
ncbi:MAG: hypothetical protein AUJ98_05425 [Bacteroidetes bacterium CG2_30_33_31]|nr:MAG: hypothetical protein AUJ98_05425 [Bacteroidetes bacterium CG2_30_33_31]